MAHIPDSETIRSARNTARFCTENPGIAWVLLLATLAWGGFGYWKMPKRKDPVIPMPTVAVVCAWPGMSAEEIEQRLTGRIEAKLAENPNIERLESIVRTNVTVSLVKLVDNLKDTDRVFDDLKAKLDAIDDLPQGAGPIVFHKGFGDTATLMLTVASPMVDGIELALRTRSLRRAIDHARKSMSSDAGRATLVVGFPLSIATAGFKHGMESLASWLGSEGIAKDARVFAGSGFFAVDVQTDADDAALIEATERFAREQSRRLHPDLWSPVVVRGLEAVESKLAAAAGPRYTYRELDEHTDLLQRILLASPKVGKVTRTGVLPEAIYLGFSHDQLAQQGIPVGAVRDVLVARNISLPGGIVETQGRNVTLSPSGKLDSEEDLRDVMLAGAGRGSPVRLRDLFEVTRDYQSPPRFLNAFTCRDARGRWQRMPAVTLAVHMRESEQIAGFGAEVDGLLGSVRTLLPPDLIVARTSDQPLQVKEGISLFTRSLWEAILLVVFIAFVGFWQWRSALLIALSIPLTLAMTFGMMHLLGIDLQQISIAALILALGLLVDDPVVAGDAIEREIEAGHPPRLAAWLGPSKLANAIIFATITNVVAYLPFLISVDGSTGHFIYSLPVVITCSLVASRVVSMTFVPLLGMYWLRGRVASRPNLLTRRFADAYRRVGNRILDHRRSVFLIAAALLVSGGLFFKNLQRSFFPKDLSYHFYVDVWTPEDSAFANTADAAIRVETIVRGVAEDFGRHQPDPGGKPRDIMRSLTTFVGGSGPRFWFSISPELQQLNYAQVVVQTTDKNDTRNFVVALQRALDRQLVGAIADVRQLETGKPVGVPVAIRLSGLETGPLRQLALRIKTILRGIPEAERVRDDWGAETLSVPLRIDPARASLSGISNLEVALSSLAATNGRQVTTLREGDQEIPVLLRERPDRHANLEELQNLYVFPTQGERGVPLRQVASPGLELRPEKIRRRNHFRTITIGAFPVEGSYAAQVFAKAKPALTALERELPPGYRMEIGGEKESQVKGFTQVATAMLISLLLIYLALVFEFRSASKPLVVFSAIPFGVVGAFASLWIVGAPLGFMAFLGIASLIGVIVSHIIVLFDFIEEARERGALLREALLNAAIVRLRPVLITVGATVLGLMPLASHGGPLWQPLCYAQIGGLAIATVTTLVLVPVIYAIFVLDLRLVRWGDKSQDEMQ
jgi:multidrug efflux pump subunit AcrB